MKRTAVASATLASIGYDEGTQTLEVEFRSGIVYRYFNVPVAVHTELISASSLGKYLSAHIKGQYGYARV